MMRRAKIVAMMPVRNEQSRRGRYLERTLENLDRWVDEIVIIDDCSTDGTPELCRKFPRVTVLDRNPTPVFAINESVVRSRLWEIAVQRQPDWLLAIDADELFEDRIVDEIDALVGQTEYEAIEFRLFDLWMGESHYRADGAWNPWRRFVRLLVRYDSTRKVSWPGLPIHTGRWPLQYRSGLPAYQSDVRVKHFGWADPEEHGRKYEFYAEWDRRLYGRITPHTESILRSSDSILLEPWVEINVNPASKPPRPANPTEVGPAFFDEEYFERGYQTGKSNYRGYTWQNVMPMAAELAERVSRLLRPKNALDVGCAKGFYVLALRRLGIEAVGIDWSEYALKTAPEEVRGYLVRADAAKIPFADRSFDLTLCLDVLEHIGGDTIGTVLDEVSRVCQRYLVIVTPVKDLPDKDLPVNEDRDPSHLTVKSRHWWVEQFVSRGFREIALDLSPTFNLTNTIAFEREVRPGADPSVPAVDGVGSHEAATPSSPKSSGG